MEMCEGKVKWYSNARGYGFLVNSDGSETFFHITQVEPFGRIVQQGDHVTYEIGMGAKGNYAINIKIIEEG